MHQSPPEYLLRQMVSNDMTKERKAASDSSTVSRKLCLVWEDGTRMRFPYHVLFAEKFHPGEDQHITLQFMTDKVTLKGINLAALMDYLADEPPYLLITPERYRQVSGPQTFIITEVVIERA